MMRYLVLTIIAASMAACVSHSILLYKGDPKERELEGVKIELLDAYYDEGIFAVELKIKNATEQTVKLDENEAVLVLDTGESIPPYAADETRSAFTRDIVYRRYIAWLGVNPVKRKALEGGSLHAGSWRSGALAFVIGDKVQSAILMISNLVEGYEIGPIGLILEGKVKVSDLYGDPSRTFLGTKRTKIKKEKNEN